MHTLMYVSTSVSGRTRNSASTSAYHEYVRDKLYTRYEHATVRRYTLPYGEDITKFCVCIKNLQRMPTYCLYVRHKLDVRNRYVMHTLRYVSTNACGRMGDSASTFLYAEYVRD